MFQGIWALAESRELLWGEGRLVAVRDGVLGYGYLLEWVEFLRKPLVALGLEFSTGLSPGETRKVWPMNPKCLYSSASDLYSTPPELFQELDRRFGPLTLDVCALPENAKCPSYFTPEQDGLKQPWTGRCWCNPPYGRTIRRWLLKAVKSALAGATVVCLLPARVDTRWWHELVNPMPAVIEFCKGRLWFGGGKIRHRSRR